MKLAPLLLLATAACSPATPPSLVGTWGVQVSGNCGVGMTFRADGSYEQQLLCLTSPTAGQDEGEMGTYEISGDQLSTTPTQTSCPAGDPDHVPASYTFALQADGSLTLSDASGVHALVRDTATGSGGGMGASLEWGCFMMGVFQPQPLHSVQ